MARWEAQTSAHLGRCPEDLAISHQPLGYVMLLAFFVFLAGKQELSLEMTPGVQALLLLERSQLNNPVIRTYVCAAVAFLSTGLFQTPRYSHAYEQLLAVTLFIKHNSSTLYWQPEVRMAFIRHRARAYQVTHHEAEYTGVKGATRASVAHFSLIMWRWQNYSRGKWKLNVGRTFPSKTISYPSLSLILL